METEHAQQEVDKDGLGQIVITDASTQQDIEVRLTFVPIQH